VSGKTIRYTLRGDQVVHEADGENSIHYRYDGSGSLVSMEYNGQEYYYIRNAQGDIIGLFDKTGTHGVSLYINDELCLL